jgi:NADH-quinone oxidoreductase subunit J
MNAVFYISAAIAIFATVMVITRASAVHALLYFVVSLLAVALVFYVLGAPFAAALEVIVYAGAIVVLFVFVVMMLNLGKESTEQERAWLAPNAWVGPAVLSIILAAELVYVLSVGSSIEQSAPGAPVGPKEVGARLFGQYLLAVEFASILLLAGLVGAYHLGRSGQRR